MKCRVHQPPRTFAAGDGVTIRDTARVHLSPDEQITFFTDTGGEYDVVRKSWGFYATPSMNGRLLKFGLRAGLVRGREGKLYIHLIEAGHEDEHAAYSADQGLTLVCWLDGTADLSAVTEDRR